MGGNENDHRGAAVEPPPQLDLYEPLLDEKIKASPRNAAMHQAEIGTKVAPIESLDFELVENELFRQDWRSRKKSEIVQYVVVKWAFVFFVGILTALAALGINIAVENIAGLKFQFTVKFMNSDNFIMAFVVYAGVNMFLVMAAALLCVYIGPSAAGSGIPEVKAYLNGVDTPNIFSIKTLIVKILGSIGSVSGGLIVGKEGPLVHVGACIASLLGQGGSTRHGLTCKWLRYLKNDRDRRDLVTCGAAAGVAAAFRAPVGGVLFALEEVTSWWRGPLLWRAFFTSAVVAVILRTGISWCKQGHCGLAGEGGLIMFDVSGVQDNYGLNELIPVVVLGVLGGVLGSLFNQINAKIIVWSAWWLKRKGKFAKITQAVIVALITSICSFGLPWLATCRPCPDHVSIPGEKSCPTYGRAGNFKNFHCPAGSYNDLAGLFFSTNEDTVRNLFSKGTNGEFQFGSLFLYLGSAYSLALLTYGIAVPSGLFVPAILCGATYGRIVGMIMGIFYTKGTFDEGVYALLGAASFLGGSMRMTVSLCIILLELTNNLLLLPLIMLVLLISKTVGDCFNDGLYSLHVHIKGIPFMEAHPPRFMSHLSARDAITQPLIWFSKVERVGTIVEVLRDTKHHAFPVVDDDIEYSGKPVLLGLVLRSHLLVLLKKKHFLEMKAAHSPEQGSLVTSAEFAKPGSGKGLTIQEIELTPAEEEMFLDIHEVSNTSPYTVVETMSLAKAYTLFRQLGLRHLCVVPRTSEGQPIIGILTRHDFMSNHLLNLFPHVRQNDYTKIQAFTSKIGETRL
jgi:chloride channel 7